MMNYEQALKASKHNPAGVMKVLKGLEVECPECLAGLPGFEPQRCNTCKGLGKIPYSWTPQVGEAFVEYGHKKPHFIRDVFMKEGYDTEVSDYFGRKFSVARHKLIPILEWEEIERVLEKVGYHLWESYSSRGRYTAGINDKDGSFGDSRQEAVYRAVLALGKEMK